MSTAQLDDPILRRFRQALDAVYGIDLWRHFDLTPLP
jgi:hypothetical protein